MAKGLDIDLGKQYGPLPLGAWIVVVGGGLGIALWARNENSSPVDDYVVDDVSGDPGVGDGSVGGWIPTVPGGGGSGGLPDDDLPTIPDIPDIPDLPPLPDPDPDPDPDPVGPSNNDEWANMAINWLIAQGYDPSASYSAIVKAIQGIERLSVSEWALWTIALKQFGAPPYPVNALPPIGAPPPPPQPPKIKPHIYQPRYAVRPNMSNAEIKKIPCKVCGLRKDDKIHIKTSPNTSGTNPGQPSTGGPKKVDPNKRHKFVPKANKPGNCKICGDAKKNWKHQ